MKAVYIHEALEFLVTKGWLRKDDEQIETRGRPRSDYIVNPGILEYRNQWSEDDIQRAIKRVLE